VSAFDVDDLNHALRNPLMIIRGHTDLLRRAIMRETTFTAAEIRGLMHHLAAIDLAVSNLVAVLEDLDQPSVDGSGT